MSNILKTLGKKKLQFLFLFYILLILPLLSPLAQNITREDVFLILIVNSLIFIAISILSVFFSPKFEKVAYSLLLTISLIPSAIFIAYLLFAHVLLQQNSVISLFETNPEESKEFIANYLNPWIIVGVLIYVLIPIIMIWKMKCVNPLNIKNHKWAFILPLVCIAILVSISHLSRSIYFLDFYKTFASYKIRLASEEKKISARQSTVYPVSIATADSVPQTIVVVIGESLTRHHMSLYGYPRNTNPLLSKMDNNLMVYKDVISPQAHTIPVIRSVFSLADNSHPEYFTTKPSLFELFNRAGFETYFISNQPFGGKHKTSYDVLLNLAQKTYSLNSLKKHDDVVLSELDSILTNKDKKNQLIVIHLIGNHMAYEFRYPSNFKLFDYTKDNAIADAKFRNKYAKEMIDKYDNSVAFNDFVIASIIKSLSDKEKAMMIYFSDHGEEVYETRDFAGHAYEKVSNYMCEIPFLVWISNKERFKNLTFDTQRGYSTEDFVYSLSDVASLEYKDFDCSRSLFSKDFAKKERFVGNHSYEKELRK